MTLLYWDTSVPRNLHILHDFTFKIFQGEHLARNSSEYLAKTEDLRLLTSWKFLRVKMTPSNLYLYSKNEV